MKRILCMLMTSCIATALAATYTMELSLVEHSDGYYQEGETITCKGRPLWDGQPLNSGENCLCTVKFEGKVVEKIPFTANGEYHEFSAKAPRPGWNHFGFEILDAEGKPRKGAGITRFAPKPSVFGEIGAVTASDRIRTSIPCPDDFVAFWEKAQQEVRALPIEAETKPLDVPEKYQGKVRLYALTVNCPTDNPVTGYLALPVEKDKKLSAVIEFLSWSWTDANRNAAMERASQGQLSMHCTWHGLPVGQPKEYYVQAGKGFNGAKGCEVRENWIFRNCALRVLRALAYLEQRSEWDGKNLAVMGGSLGGFEASVASALDKRVTLAIISVPTFCEFDAPMCGRFRSLPFQGGNGSLATPKTMEQMAYYDCVNFARFITCETFVCTGFADELCPPSNVFAMYNNIPSTTRKEMSTSPLTGHYGTTKNVKGNQRIQDYLRGITVRKFDDY